MAYGFQRGARSYQRERNGKAQGTVQHFSKSPTVRACGGRRRRIKSPKIDQLPMRRTPNDRLL